MGGQNVWISVPCRPTIYWTFIWIFPWRCLYRSMVNFNCYVLIWFTSGVKEKAKHILIHPQTWTILHLKLSCLIQLRCALRWIKAMLLIVNIVSNRVKHFNTMIGFFGVPNALLDYECPWILFLSCELDNNVFYDQIVKLLIEIPVRRHLILTQSGGLFSYSSRWVC